MLASFIAGGVAGAISRTVVSPLERLKILFQVQNVGRTEYKMSVGKALAKMWREEGWRGLMAGNGTNCIRIVPYSAVQFGSYNFYKRVSLPLILDHCTQLRESMRSRCIVCFGGIMKIEQHPPQSFGSLANNLSSSSKRSQVPVLILISDCCAVALLALHQ